MTMGASRRKDSSTHSRTSSGDEFAAVGIYRIALRDDDDAFADARKLRDLQVLDGLRHDAFVDIYDEQHGGHARGPRDHRPDEFFVARRINDAQLARGKLEGASTPA